MYIYIYITKLFQNGWIDFYEILYVFIILLFIHNRRVRESNRIFLHNIIIFGNRCNKTLYTIETVETVAYSYETFRIGKC